MACFDNGTATAYLLGDLEPHEEALWARHLADCSRCQQLVRDVSGLMESVRKDLMLAYSDDADVDLSRAAKVIGRRPPVGSRRHESAGASDGKRVGWFGLRSIPGRAAVAAASVLVVLLVLPSGTLAWIAQNVQAAIQRAIDGIRGSERSPGETLSRVGKGSDVELPLPPIKRPEIVPPPAPRAAVLGPADLALLEMQVLARLDSIDALVGGQVEVVRTDSRIDVRGLVDDTEKRRAIASALARMSGVRVSVRAVSDELRAMPPPAGPIQYRPMEFDSGGIPVASDLRAYLARSGRTGDPDGEVRRIVTVSLRHSRVALRHALAMESLAERYEAEALRSLNPKAYEVWVQLIATHASTFANETRQLRELLEPAFSTGEAANVGIASAGKSSATDPINAVVTALTRLAVTIDDVVRQGMTTSNTKPERVQVREAEFWQTVRQAERLGQVLSK
jgi:anti-sigma factor RsiW